MVEDWKIRTNLVTLRRHIERRLSERVLKLETPGGGKVWGLKKPCSLYHIAAMHTEIVGDRAGKWVDLVPSDYIHGCSEWHFDHTFLDYDTRRDETAEEEAARFNEAEHSDAEEIYFYSELDVDEHEDHFTVYLECKKIIKAVFPRNFYNRLIGFYDAASFTDCYLILALEEMGDGLSAVTYEQGINWDLSLIGALEPGNDPEVVSAFVRHFISNPEDFTGGAKVFDFPYGGGDYLEIYLPDSVSFLVPIDNYKPHLLSPEAIRDGLCAHLPKAFALRNYRLEDYLKDILNPSSPSRPRRDIIRIAEKLWAAWKNREEAIPLSKKEVDTLVDWHLEENYEEVILTRTAHPGVFDRDPEQDDRHPAPWQAG